MAFKRNITLNFLARSLLAGSNVLLTVYLARSWGAELSGAVFYQINNFAAAALMGSLCLETGFSYYLSKKAFDPDELPAFMVGWSLFAGLLSSVLFLLAGGPMNLPVYHKRFPILALVFISGTIGGTYYTSLFYAQKEFFLPLAIPAITNLLLLLTGVLAIDLYHVFDPRLLIITYVSIALLNAILLAISFHLKYRVPFRFSFPGSGLLKKIWAFSRLALATNLLSFLAFRVDYWILNYYQNQSVTAADLGNYIQVAKMNQAFLLLPNILATVIFPTTASGDSVDMHQKTGKLMRLVLVFNLALIAFFSFTGNRLFPFIFGANFTSIHSCFLFSIPAILSLSLISVIAAYFAGINRISYNLKGSFIAFIAVMGLNLVLDPIYGIYGAAVSDSIGYMLYLGLLLYYFRNKTTAHE